MKSGQMKLLSRCETYIIIGLILLTSFLNILTFLHRSLDTPSGKFFTGAQFYTDDYAVYVSYIEQGQRGRWTVVDRFTSEPHPSSLVHEEYLLWGKLTGIFGIPPVFAYHLSRLVFGLIFLVFIYILLLNIFPKAEESFYRVASFLLICFSGGFLNKEHKPFMDWMTELDPTQRFGSVMHYSLGFICLLGIFSWFFSKKRNNYWIPLAFGIILAFVLPAGLIIAITTLLVFNLFILAKSGNFREPVTQILVLGLSGLPAFLYYRSIFNVPPWSHILSWEKLNMAVFPHFEYLLALGPIFFLAPLGLLCAARRKRLVLFLSAWALSVFIWGFYLGIKLNLNITRFLQTPVFIPLSVMTVLGVSQIIKRQAYGFFAILAILLISLPTNIISLKNHLRMYADYSGLVYPEKNAIEAYRFLKENTSPDQAVLALYQAGNQIPFLAGNTVFLGHLQETINYQGKVKEASSFFSGIPSEDEAEKFLRDNGIDLIFYSPHEKSWGGKIDEWYPFLKPIYSSEQVTIFAVR